MSGYCECSVSGCREFVLSRKEQSAVSPYCYFHRKVVSGLIGNPMEYTIIIVDSNLDFALSSPADYEMVDSKNYWRL